MTYVVTRGEVADEQIIAIGNYVRLPRWDTAEVAFFVDDAYHGKGLGTVLLERLAEHAKQQRILTIVATVRPENQSSSSRSPFFCLDKVSCCARDASTCEASFLVPIGSNQLRTTRTGQPTDRITFSATLPRTTYRMMVFVDFDQNIPVHPSWTSAISLPPPSSLSFTTMRTAGLDFHRPF